MTKALPAHKLVAETAKALTHELYSELMGNDEMWRAWQEQHPGKSRKALELLFVEKYKSWALQSARATLALMLRTSTDEHLKEIIHDALLLDNGLRGQRSAPPTIQGVG